MADTIHQVLYVTSTGLGPCSSGEYTFKPYPTLLESQHPY